MNEINLIKQFLAKEIEIDTFATELQTNSALQSMIEAYCDNHGYMDGLPVYYYLLELDLSKIDNVLTLIDSLKEILDKNGTPYRLSPFYQEKFEFMQNAVPNWLPNNCHYIDNLYNQYYPHRLKELKKIIKEKFRGCTR